MILKNIENLYMHNHLVLFVFFPLANKFHNQCLVLCKYAFIAHILDILNNFITRRYLTT